MKPAILLIGAGGYGEVYLRALFQELDAGRMHIPGMVSPYGVPDETLASKIKALSIPVYASLAAFRAAHTADLAIIASPIHFHAPQTIESLSAGMNVLCEKPACAQVPDVRRMQQAEQAAGKFVAIGYDWSFSDTIHAVKRDLMSGRLGRPLRFKTLALSPRTRAYYRRNDWAGRIKTDAGRWVLDSPLNNASAHYLHNMFYLLGPTLEASAQPQAVTAELYRANAIESYDTGALRAQTDIGTEILFWASHAIPKFKGVTFCLECEDGSLTYASNGNGISAHFKDGRVKSYGNPGERQNPRMPKLDNCLMALSTQTGIRCGLEAALAQTRCIHAAQIASEIVPFPESMRRILPGDEETVYIPGLLETLQQCYQTGMLPAEMHVPWAVKSRTIATTDDAAFSTNAQPRR